MDLDGVSGLLYLLAHWRAALCLAASSAIAFLLVHWIPWLTGIQGIVLAALGLLPGLLWEEADRPSPPSPKVGTGTAVAVSTAIVFGSVWGAAGSHSVPSALAGMAILVAAAWGWYRYAVVSRQWLSRKQGILCTLAAALAYPFAAITARHAF